MVQGRHSGHSLVVLAAAAVVRNTADVVGNGVANFVAVDPAAFICHFVVI